jgi:hypothetical protein
VPTPDEEDPEDPPEEDPPVDDPPDPEEPPEVPPEGFEPPEEPLPAGGAGQVTRTCFDVPVCPLWSETVVK